MTHGVSLSVVGDLTGEVLDGRYRLESTLGAGGMGVVYRAQDTVLDRPVAVKVFRGGAPHDARTVTETHCWPG